MYTYIPLFKIDENVLTKVREVNEYSENYAILFNSIIDDDQRYPIILRKLTQEERNKRTNFDAIYGIIDGHHRYRIALKNKKKDILAYIMPTPTNKDYDQNDNDTPQEFLDIRLALRLNESSIKMTNEEKGKIIYDLMFKMGKSAPDIANKIFGVKTSMAYRCLNAYKKSIGESVISRPKGIKDFKIKTLKTAWQPISKITTMPTNIEECTTCLDDIAVFEKELRKFKRALLAQKDLQVKLPSSN